PGPREARGGVAASLSASGERMSEITDTRSSGEEPDLLSELPGELMMWVLIASEILVFGAALLAFLSIRIAHPVEFAADQAMLYKTAGAINTIVLVTSGFCAAAAIRAREAGKRGTARRWLLAAGSLGFVFLAVKAFEYGSKAALGIGIESS